MLKFSQNALNMVIICRFSRFLAQACQFKEAGTNKSYSGATSVSTRFDRGVLKFLHDMKRGC